MAGCDAHNEPPADEDAARKRIAAWSLGFAAAAAILTYLNLAGASVVFTGPAALAGVGAIIFAAVAAGIITFSIAQVVDWFSRLKEQNPKTITISGRVFCAGKNPFGLQPWTDGDWTTNLGNNASLALLAPSGLPVTAPGAVTQMDEVRTRAAPGSGLARAFKSFNEEAHTTDILHCEISSHIGAYGVIGGMVGTIAGAIAGAIIGAVICAALGIATFGIGLAFCALIVALAIALGAAAGYLAGATIGAAIGALVDGLSDFDKLGKTIESNRNCVITVTGTWVTDTSHQHNEIHDIEAVVISDCGVGSASGALQVTATVGIGRHPSGEDP
jgi:hypothetical protein